MEKLSPRLETIRKLLPRAYLRLFDVACDHALVSVAELLEGKCQSVLAMDLRSEPLERAKANLQTHCADLTWECRLSNGFGALSVEEAFLEGDVLLLSGLGGLEIHDILMRAYPLFVAYSKRSKEPLKLCLQAQKSHSVLRFFLKAIGFEWETEAFLPDSKGCYYEIMSLSFLPSSIEQFGAYLERYARAYEACLGEAFYLSNASLAKLYLKEEGIEFLAAERARLGLVLRDLLVDSGTNLEESTVATFYMDRVKRIKDLARYGAFWPGYGRLKETELAL